MEDQYIHKQTKATIFQFFFLQKNIGVNYEEL
jgi:hypothetical protein